MNKSPNSLLLRRFTFRYQAALAGCNATLHLSISSLLAPGKMSFAGVRAKAKLVPQISTSIYTKQALMNEYETNAALSCSSLLDMSQLTRDARLIENTR